jgi:DNA-binding LacI/PurR family transcriptional regulator
LVGIRELARHLEISIGAVSRALNDRADVNPLTRQRVRDAAAKLGYSPNQSGRSLRRGQTDLVVVILPSAKYNMYILYNCPEAGAKEGQIEMLNVL